jgi:hypothetical protein
MRTLLWVSPMLLFVANCQPIVEETPPPTPTNHPPTILESALAPTTSIIHVGGVGGTCDIINFQLGETYDPDTDQNQTLSEHWYVDPVAGPNGAIEGIQGRAPQNPQGTAPGLFIDPEPAFSVNPDRDLIPGRGDAIDPSLHIVKVLLSDGFDNSKTGDQLLNNTYFIVTHTWIISVDGTCP